MDWFHKKIGPLGPTYESPDRQVRVRDENVIWSPEGATYLFTQIFYKKGYIDPSGLRSFFPYYTLTWRSGLSYLGPSDLLEGRCCRCLKQGAAQDGDGGEEIDDDACDVDDGGNKRG